MGRLQKKKTVSQKLKKKQKIDIGSGAEQISDDNNVEQSRGTETAGVQKRKVLNTQTPSGGPSVVDKILEGDNVVARSVQFLREVKVELKKVIWPTRKQTIASTVVVIVLVILISIFLGIVDFGLSGLIRIVLQ